MIGNVKAGDQMRMFQIAEKLKRFIPSLRH
jgi:hypothetical protein